MDKPYAPAALHLPASSARIRLESQGPCLVGNDVTCPRSQTEYMRVVAAAGFTALCSSCAQQLCARAILAVFVQSTRCP